MSTMTETTETVDSFDESVREELEQLSYWSHGDHVEVKVTKVRQNQANSDKVKVTFDPPAGDEFMREMTVPKDPSHESEFTALLRTVGHNYDNAQQVIGERVPANYTDDGWQIDYAEPDRTGWERVTTRFDPWTLLAGCSIATVLLLYPIAMPIVIAVMALDEDSVDYVTMTFIYVVGTLLYLVLLFFAVDGIQALLAPPEPPLPLTHHVA